MAPEGSVGEQPVVESTPASPVQPAMPAPGSSTPAPSQPVAKWEDDPRAKGMLADLQKERKARQDFERQFAAAEARAAERDRQIAALTNTKPPTPEEADIEAIRERFAQLFPHLAELTPEDIQALRESRDQQGQFTEAIQARWTDHSRRILDDVYKGIADEIGELTPRQKHRIGQLYVAEAEASPEFLQRHNAGDKTLVAEFVKGYLEDTVEPIRRKVTATEVARQRRVPSGGDRQIATGGKTIDPKDDKAVMDFIMESRHGKFGR